MRTEAEQIAGLKRLGETANQLHRISYVIVPTGADEVGDVAYLHPMKHGAEHQFVYAVNDYDHWVRLSERRIPDTPGTDLDIIETDLSLDRAAEVLAECYMQAKLIYVVTQTWSEPLAVAKAMLADPVEREKFYAAADKASNNVEFSQNEQRERLTRIMNDTGDWMALVLMSPPGDMSMVVSPAPKLRGYEILAPPGDEEGTYLIRKRHKRFPSTSFSLRGRRMSLAQVAEFLQARTPAEDEFHKHGQEWMEDMMEFYRVPRRDLG